MAIPFISIIVPIYNAEPWLDKCIESILTQQFRDFELILIDDGTDNSGHICDEYANTDNRIRVFHQENKGTSAARNHGILQSNGDWITFIDADDWVESSYLSDFPLTSLNPTHFYTQDFNVEHLPNSMMLRYSSSCLKLFSTEIIKKHHLFFSSKLFMNEDTAFNIIYSQYVLDTIDLPVQNYHYRFVPDSYTRKKVDNYEQASICIETLKYLKKTICPTPVYSIAFLDEIIRVNCFNFTGRIYASAWNAKQRLYYLRRIYPTTEDINIYYTAMFKTDRLARFFLRLHCYLCADCVISIGRKLRRTKSK